MSQVRSLRFQLTVTATVLVAIVIALAGVTIATRLDQQARNQVDEQLDQRADKLIQDFAKDSQDPLNGSKPEGERNGTGNELLTGSDSFTRIIAGHKVIDQRGDIPSSDIAIPHPVGFDVVDIDGQRWRSLVRPLDATTQVQVLQSLGPVDQRREDNTQLILLVTIAAVIVTAAGTWASAGLLLRPLQRLRVGALSIEPGTDTDQQLPAIGRPQEVADLAATLNAMLERLRTSTEATRRFTADAGHELRTPLSALGMDLETLGRHPDLPREDQAAMVAAMTVEHHRMATLLDGLLTLARGDAEALPTRTPVDVGEVVQAAVAGAQHRHQDLTYRFDHPRITSVASGWPDGIRLAIDNLLENAARHGAPNGHIDVTVTGGIDHIVITVADDGPGIPVAERLDVLGRFTRGANGSQPGSGLGLALVDQQARLHGGSLVLGESGAGGLAASMHLPRSAEGLDQDR